VNLLLISYSFPPAGGVGVLRAASLAKYLPEEGVRVDVLTARNAAAVGADEALRRQIPAGVIVHDTLTLDLPFGVRKALKRLVAGGKKSTASSTPARPGLLKRVVGNLLLPDPQIGWLPFALPAAKRIIERRQIDAVLITVPPFSSVRLATSLRKRYPRLPIVLDFRDEWLTSTIDFVSFNNNDRARTIARRTEREGVRAASAVVAVTDAARREIHSRYPNQTEDKFRHLPNGFDRTPNAPAPRAPDGKTVLTYLGSVYGSTDPRTLVEAVKCVPDDIRAQLLIRYIGHVESAAYRDALLSLGDTVELRGFLPQAEALRAIDETDYLLLVTLDRINVSAKLYDYLGGGRPIIGAVHPDGDVRRILDETGGGWWADVADPRALRQLLIDAVGRRDSLANAFSPRADRIATYHRRVVAKRYAALLRELVKR
jgi:glycosyltransferase involved in cell wall biosynthesis